MYITNHSRSDLTLASGTTIPAGQTISVSEKELTSNKGSAVVEAWFSSGALSGSESMPSAPSAPIDLSPAPAREDSVMEIMREVAARGDAELMTADGKPKTDAINAELVKKNLELTTSAERDELWSRIESEKS